MQVAGESKHGAQSRLLVICGHCEKPCSALVVHHSNNVQLAHSSIIYNSQNAGTLFGDVLSDGWKLVGFWPSPQKPDIPEFLPDSVCKAFTQAEKARLSPDMEEATASMYRRALEMATKELAPDFPGLTLVKRIDKLVADHRLPPAIGELSHQVRLAGNDSLHDIDGITKVEVDAMRSLTRMIVTYIFTLPQMLESARDVATKATSS